MSLQNQERLWWPCKKIFTIQSFRIIVALVANLFGATLNGCDCIFMQQPDGFVVHAMEHLVCKVK